MYYDEIKQKSHEERWMYSDEVVDGKPRYRWYKMALSTVDLISGCDDKFDIARCSFKDLAPWYEAAEWVALNDPEALVHIMRNLIPPVNNLVKQKLMEGLSREGDYKACAIVQQHLRSFPVPEERTFSRRKKKAVEYINMHVINVVKGNCAQLEKFKADCPDKLLSNDPEIQKALSVALHIEFFLFGECLDKSLGYLEWMRLNAPDELKQLFSFSICPETKEQLLKLFEKAELFRLHTFIDKCITIKPDDFYYLAQPYVRSRRDILSDYIDMDDDYDD